MCVFYLGHAKGVAFLAVDHYRESGVVCNARVIVGVGMFHVDDILFVGRVAQGGEVAVALVDGVCLGGDGRVDVAVHLLDVRHCFQLTVIYEKYYTKENRRML
jgi:hypothetical protein